MVQGGHPQNFTLEFGEFVKTLPLESFLLLRWPHETMYNVPSCTIAEYFITYMYMLAYFIKEYNIVLPQK